MELARDISIFVGANNSGKTSATQAIQMFLSGRKDQFSLFDFNSHTWRLLNEIGNADLAGNAEQHIPSIILDRWFEVAEADLYLVLPILPSTAWEPASERRMVACVAPIVQSDQVRQFVPGSLASKVMSVSWSWHLIPKSSNIRRISVSVRGRTATIGCSRK